MKKTLLLVFVLLVVSLVIGIEGYVFVDLNSNGILDAEDQVVQGCLISNGIEIVSSDSGGFYNISDSNGFVFLIKPDGYVCSEWYARGVENHDFLLTPIVENGVFAVVNDIHYADDPDLFYESLGDREMIDNPDEYMTKLVSILETISPDFIVCNGDMGASIKDIDDETATRWATKVRDYLTVGDIPVYYSVGNHETNKKKEDPYDIFHNAYGPEYYSFNSCGTHYIVLNTHNVVDGSFIYEIDSVQLEWLRRDIESVALNTRIIAFSHEPIFNLAKTDNYYEMMQIFADECSYHISGHRHTMIEYFDAPFVELTCGAISGAWWEGPSPTGDEYGFTLFEMKRNDLNYCFVTLTEDYSGWFDMSRETPYSGVEYIRFCTFPSVSDDIEVLLNDRVFECDVLKREMRFWSEYYFNINLSSCDDGLNEIVVRTEDREFRKKLFVRSAPVDIKSMKANPEYFEGALVLVSNCSNTGQWGTTYTFNDGSDTFMVQITNLDIPFAISKDEKYSLYGIFRNNERVVDPLKLLVAEGIVQEE
ncbi:metallophosphoesterase [Mesotoga sp.]|uniref:metallophosphoesterase family protein n=1 Tax=Mesotoga sp. TaxID=2053577 RepID=UPI001BD33C05|nr:metallophosphoesterase [Mesotoga sp.]